MSPLAAKILELDRLYPGAAEADFDVPAAVWDELVALAKAEPSMEAASLREALECARQNIGFAHHALKNPTMGGEHVPKARGFLEQAKADIGRELAKAVAS